LLKTDKSLKVAKLQSIATNNDKLEFAKKFEKTVLKKFEKETLPVLEARMIKARKELEEERKKFDVVER